MKAFLSLLLSSIACFAQLPIVPTQTATAANPNADLNIGVYAAYACNNGTGVGNSQGNQTDYSGHGFTITDCNTSVLLDNGFGNINFVSNFHANNGDNVRGFHIASTLSLSANQVFTVMAWVKLSATTASNPVFDQWGSTPGWYLGQSGGNKWTFGVHDSSGTSQFLPDGSLTSTSTGAWHLLFGGWDGSHIWFSLDAGTAVTAAVATTHAASDDVEIGRYASGCSGSINTDGWIAECVIWTNVTVSASQRTRIYNSGNGLAMTIGGPF